MDKDLVDDLSLCVPIHMQAAFQPHEILGSDPAGWVGMLRALSSALPTQIHCEPQDMNGSEIPLFVRVTELLKSTNKVDDLLLPAVRARIKMRLSDRGKFIHRNRYRRRNIVCCMKGEQSWILMHGPGVDEYLGADTNDNWNGYRSKLWPASLSVSQMEQIVKNAPPGTKCHMLKLKAGDALTFDGRWWHATHTSEEILNLFYTPGEDMEVAVKEHSRRMKMPMQKGLKCATINMAKCSRLASSWQTLSDGSTIDWETVPH